MQEYLPKIGKPYTDTQHTLLVLTNNIEGLVKGEKYKVFTDVDNEWFVVDDDNDERHTFFSYNDLKEEFENDLELRYEGVNMNNVDKIVCDLLSIDTKIVDDNSTDDKPTNDCLADSSKKVEFRIGDWYGSRDMKYGDRTVTNVFMRDGECYIETEYQLSRIKGILRHTKVEEFLERYELKEQSDSSFVCEINI